MSLPEVLPWQRLRGAPEGVRFRNQHPIGAYRSDFYCAAAKLVIESDGMAHDMGDRPSRDAARTIALQEKGYKVVRVPATDVLCEPDGVAASIIALASRPLHRSFGTVPLPASGEDPCA